MAVRLNKQKLLIILVIALTVLVGAAAVITAIFINNNNLNNRSKAGSNPECNLYNGDYGPGGIAHCTDAHQICGGVKDADGQCIQVGEHCTDTPICDACESGFRLQGNSCVQDNPQETCRVGNNDVQKSGFCSQSLADITGQNADAKAAWCGSCCGHAGDGGETTTFCQVSGDPKCGVNGNPFEPSNNCQEGDKAAYCSFRNTTYCAATGACTTSGCPTTPTTTATTTPTPTLVRTQCGTDAAGNSNCYCGTTLCGTGTGKFTCDNTNSCKAVALSNCSKEFLQCNGNIGSNVYNDDNGNTPRNSDGGFAFTLVDSISGSQIAGSVEIAGTGAIGVQGNYAGKPGCMTPDGVIGSAYNNGATIQSGQAVNNLNCLNAPFSVRNVTVSQAGYVIDPNKPCVQQGDIVCKTSGGQGKISYTCFAKPLAPTPTTVPPKACYECVTGTYGSSCVDSGVKWYNSPTECGTGTNGPRSASATCDNQCKVVTSTPTVQQAYCNTSTNQCSLTQAPNGRPCTTNTQCQPQTHLTCQNNACVQVSGAGNNDCTNNDQCNVTQDNPQCTGLTVQKNGVTLLNGQTVNPGDTLTYTLTGQINPTTPATQGRVAISASPSGTSTSTNGLTGSIIVPSSGTGVSIVGYVKDRAGSEVTPGNQCKLALALPQPKFEMDKVAINNSRTGPITGGERCDDPANPKLNCPSVGVQQNDIITYRLLMKNTGTVDITNAIARDFLTNQNLAANVQFDASNATPALTMKLCTNAPGSLSSGVCSGYAGDTSRNKDLSPALSFPQPGTAQLVWAAVPVIHPNEVFEAEVKIRVLVNTPGDITNTLRVRTDQVCQNGCDDSIVHSSELTISKTASTVTAVQGDTVTYTLNVRNPTGAAISGVDIIDTPTQPFYRYFDMTTATSNSSNSTPGGAGVFNPNAAQATSIRWMGQTIPANTTATFTYTLKLLSDINPIDDTCRVPINNAATITAPGVSKSTGQFTLTVQLPAARCVKVPGLKVTKTATPQATCANAQVNFTITVSNTGETDQLIREIVDDLDLGFVYRAGTSRFTAPGNNVFMLEPALSNNNLRLTWNLTGQSGGGITLRPSENLVIGFSVNAPNATSGTYRNRVYVSSPYSETAETSITMTNGCTPVTGIETQIVIAGLAAAAIIGLGVVAHKTRMMEGLYAGIGSKLKNMKSSRNFEDRVMKGADQTKKRRRK